MAGYEWRDDCYSRLGQEAESEWSDAGGQEGSAYGSIGI